MADDPRNPQHSGSFEPDPDAPPSAEELAAAESLREALEGRGDARHPDAELARALRHAVAPRAILPGDHRRILDRVVPLERRRTTIFVAASAFAAAAAIVVAVTSLGSRTDAPAAALAKPRTTQDLFDAPFPREGGTTDRIDAIVASRTRDLRGNRWAKWGVK